MTHQTDAWDDWESEDYSRANPKPGTSSSSSNVTDGHTLSANAKLWQVANSSLSFVPSTGNPSSAGSIPASAYSYQSSSSTNLPPPQAFMPSLKILKRPSSAASGGSSSATSVSNGKTEKQTLQDRERAYREARSRIFGSQEQPQESPSSSVPASTENSENEEGQTRRNKKGGSSSSSSARKKKSESTTTSTIVREPINPPSAQKEKGFTRTRRSKTPLSPSAQEFTPSSFRVGVEAGMQNLRV